MAQPVRLAGAAGTKVEIFRQLEPEADSQIFDVVNRTWRLTMTLTFLAFVFWLAIYWLVDIILFLTVSGGLVFAGLLSFINSCFNQSRFHYKYLLLNESCSRFIAVLASFLLGRIIAFDGKITINNTFWVCFFLSGIAFCMSVFLTNKLKNQLSDKSRHVCAELMSPVFENSPVDAGFNQKECASVTGPTWLELKRQLDRISNLNVSLFLAFFLVICGVLMFVSLRGDFQPIHRIEAEAPIEPSVVR